MTENTLYYGDNLDILRRYIKDESVDLVYLDPPFNSKATYNVLFAEKNGSGSAAQLQAFKDTWSWPEAAQTFEELKLLQGTLGDAMRAFGQLLPRGGLLAYLVMMGPRLAELHRVLKPTGSIYLHCDPTASHYLKVLMDAVFDVRNMRAEIIWKRHSAHNDARQTYAAVTDTILFYAKSDDTKFNVQRGEYDPEYVKRFFRHVDEQGRRYRVNSLKSPSPRPNLTYEYKGYPPPPTGWTCNRERMEQYEKDGRLEFPKKLTGRIGLRYYLEDMKGPPVPNLWDDIKALSGTHAERLGYPTQKPEALLERIVAASSDEGDLVLDPFCGCGTATIAAQRLSRRWIGIDITQAAIVTIKKRLADTFDTGVTYQVIGEPTTVPDAEALANQDPYQFQWWSLGLVGARPVEQKKGADKGIDGRLYYRDNPGEPEKQIILSVKAGHTNAAHVRDLRGVIDREGAEIGVLLTMQEPTGPMRAEAASAGVTTSPWGKHPRLQILTIEELLAGKKIDYPPAQGINVTFKQAPKAKKGPQEQQDILL